MGASDLIYTTKEAITQHLEDTITTMIQAQNPNGKVDRQHFEDFGNYEYPSAFLNEVRDTPKRYARDLTKMVSMYTIILFDHSEAEELSTKLNSLVKLGKEALLESPTRGGIAYNTNIVSIDTDEGFLFPHCVAVFTVEVTYLTEIVS